MKTISVAVLLLAMVGCSTKAYDYSRFVSYMPKSILVLPPLNETAEVNASDAFLSTVSRPLAECGYYVFPAAVVDHMLKENGVPTPEDMRQVPLRKLKEVFGADAVLYVTIKDWTTTYLVVDSTTKVRLEYALVDLESGEIIWHAFHTVTDSSNNGSSDAVGILAGALVHAISNVASGRERILARTANEQCFNNKHHGLLRGHRHPDFDKEQQRLGGG